MTSSQKSEPQHHQHPHSERPTSAPSQWLRTLISLGVALAAGSDACIKAMMNKAQAQHLDEAKILETVKIARCRSSGVALIEPLDA